ncbi:MAG: choice-of-anchor A family protein [Kiritimatiellia bacterium]
MKKILDKIREYSQANGGIMKSVNFLQLAYSCFAIFLIQAVSAEGLGEILSGYTPGGTTYDSSWSVFVGGDLTLNPGAVRAEGRVFVRNNLTLATSFSYAVGAGGGSVTRPPDGSEVLVVGNNVLGSGVFNLGDFGYRARVENTIAPGIAFGWWGSLPAIQGGVDNARADLLLADLQQKSTYWGSLSSTPGGSLSSDPWHVYITADGINGNPKLWIFNLGYDVVPSVNVEFIGFEPGDTILINVNKAGAADISSLSPSGFVVNPEFSTFINSRLLWNFPDAVTVELAGLSALPGAVLIANPSSTTIVSMPTHNGRFVTCGNLVHVPSGGPGGRVFNNYPFDGDLPGLPNPPSPPANLLISEVATLTPEMISVAFNTESGLVYQVMGCEVLGASWSVESVQYPIENGFSELSNQPFTALGDKTKVRVPRNDRKKAFFKIIQAQ